MTDPTLFPIDTLVVNPLYTSAGAWSDGRLLMLGEPSDGLRHKLPGGAIAVLSNYAAYGWWQWVVGNYQALRPAVEFRRESPATFLRVAEIKDSAGLTAPIAFGYLSWLQRRHPDVRLLVPPAEPIQSKPPASLRFEVRIVPLVRHGHLVGCLMATKPEFFPRDIVFNKGPFPIGSPAVAA